MKLKLFKVLLSAFAVSSLTTSVDAAYVFQNGRFVDACEAATLPVADHYAIGGEAINRCDWEEAAKQFSIITVNFPTSVYGQEGYFYLGVAYFYLEEYDYANDAFSNYLKAQSNPKLFQESIEYKFCIADRLSSGAKRRFFGTKQLPKWACGKKMALEIYDEVIVAVPCSEIAAQSLIAKGRLLWENREYHEAVDSFQQVIRRFSKHEYAPECYVYISKIYLEQVQYEFQNPDILAFAIINQRRFERDFPREERICEVQADLLASKEIYAEGLYETGQFYERVRKPGAAVIYYHDVIHQFPETCTADLSRERLSCIDPRYVQACLAEIIDDDQSSSAEESVQIEIIEDPAFSEVNEAEVVQ